jgi:hypothetical protein
MTKTARVELANIINNVFILFNIKYTCYNFKEKAVKYLFPTFLALLSGAAFAQQTQVTVSPVTHTGGPANVGVVRAMPLPKANVSSITLTNSIQVNLAHNVVAPPASSVVVAEGRQTQQAPIQASPMSISLTSDGLMSPQEHGSVGNTTPYTTSRINLDSLGTVVRLYPHSATGLLLFKIGSNTFQCTASLIRPGIIVTAAHCVQNYGGRNTLFTNFQFIPAAYRSGSNIMAPYGIFTGRTVIRPTAWASGNDSCAVAGVMCRNDVALITLNRLNNRNASSYVGGTLGFAFVTSATGPGLPNSSAGLAQIAQLGYPVSHDIGAEMQKTDVTASTSNASYSDNNLITSRQTGGSSGGPWIMNLGPAAALSGGATFGSASSRNIVVGVTSWGTTDDREKTQGASPFNRSNIEALWRAACPLSGAQDAGCN